MASAQGDAQFFHESWYRIAGERLALRASVRVRRQHFRGARWYVLHEPFSDQFFRLRPPAYEFVSRLDGTRTVDEVWKGTIERDPDGAPGQEEVIQLLSQLFHANLLHFDLPADSEKLFERYRERKQAIRHATLRSIMFFRVPLFDPNGLLRRLAPLIRVIFSPFGMVAWLAAVIGAVTVVANQFGAFRLQTQGLLALSNLPLLYLSIILIKTLHEFGHAAAVRRYGGSVHTMGVMFLIFNPLPYTDSTAAWAFRSKWQRVLVGAAGMLAELLFAAIAAFIWAGTGEGTLHSLAYNVVLVASISTVVFNINPLMRFDGYYILSDLLDIPNLAARSSRQLRHLVERYAFGVKSSESPADSRSEAAWLTVFGLASGLYRLVVFSTILLIIADRFLLLGIIMAAVCAVAWVVTPLVRLIGYLATNPRLERTRARAVLACAVGVATVVGLLGAVPFTNGFTSPGVLQATRSQLVVNEVAGYVEEILVPSNTRVRKGDALVRLANQDLAFQLEQVRAHLEESAYLRQKALSRGAADLSAVESTIASISKELDRLRGLKEALTVRADLDGVWAAPDARQLVGAWIRRGTRIGRVIDDSAFYFASVISEQNVSSVFSGAILSSSVRVASDPGSPLAVGSMTRIPVEQTRLPSAALGFAGGGSVATSASNANGWVASQPFYELRLSIAPGAAAPLVQGLSGAVRFRLPPEPLLVQAYFRLRQLLQARYQI